MRYMLCLQYRSALVMCVFIDSIMIRTFSSNMIRCFHFMESDHSTDFDNTPIAKAEPNTCF